MNIAGELFKTLGPGAQGGVIALAVVALVKLLHPVMAKAAKGLVDGLKKADGSLPGPLHVLEPVAIGAEGSCFRALQSHMADIVGTARRFNIPPAVAHEIIGDLLTAAEEDGMLPPPVAPETVPLSPAPTLSVSSTVSAGPSSTAPAGPVVPEVTFETPHTTLITAPPA